MPYVAMKKTLSEVQDRRVKLTREQKSEICLLRHTDNLSQRTLAKMFGVSRRTIQFILDPQKLIDNRKRRDERGGWEQYYDKEKHRDYMKKHRRYKHSLHKKGEL